jgi:phosphomannomutase/phosphoglucomutase
LTGIFRAYDIRGIFGETLTPEISMQIGKAFGSFLKEEEGIVVGRDVRLSGPALEAALISGLMSTGHDCTEIGMVSTPMLYFSTVYEEKRAGVMLTASHNPPQYNGFKFCYGGVSYSYETCIGEIERLVEKDEFKLSEWDSTGQIEYRDILPDYLDDLVDRISLERGLRVIVDVGNGSCGFIKDLLERLGCSVKVLFQEPDGRFPNHAPDPLRRETLDVLRAEVLKESADLGVAFDGDGDRVGFVDNGGEIVGSDFSLMIFARDLLDRFPGSKVVLNPLCSRALVEYVEGQGGISVMSRVGHSYIHEKLIEEEGGLAGEISGHFYFPRDHYGFDDGVFAGLKMIELLSKTSNSFSEIVSDLPSYPSSPEIRIQCPDNRKFLVVDVLRDRFREKGMHVIDIDGARVEFDQGWGLVRASNTEPALVLRFEGDSVEDLEKIRETIMTEVESVLKVK